MKRTEFEVLESRQFLSGAFSAHIDFQPASAIVPAHYKADTGAQFARHANGLQYGWNGNAANETVEQPAAHSPDQRYNSFLQMQAGGQWSWQIAVPHGAYTVSIVAGDPLNTNSIFKIDVNGLLTVNGTPTAANHWVQGINTIAVNNGRLTISNAPGAQNNKICFVDITQATETLASAPAPSDKLNWSPAKSTPEPRFEGTSAVVDGKLYTFGGYGLGSFTPIATANVYDPSTNTWADLKNMPLAMTQMGTATDGKFIYLAGGYVAKPTQGQFFATKDVWRYDPATDTYSKMPSLPAARGVGTMEYLAGKLYFFGGSDAGRIDRADLYMLDLAQPAAGWTRLASMPAPRNRMGGAVFGRFIYAIGGQTSFDAMADYQSDVWRYDTATNKWATMASLINQPRSHISNATTVLNGKILVLGGEGAQQQALNNVDAYDPISNSWSSLEPLPSPRDNGVADVINGQILFTGGLNGIVRPDTWLGTFT